MGRGFVSILIFSFVFWAYPVLAEDDPAAIQVPVTHQAYRGPEEKRFSFTDNSAIQWLNKQIKRNVKGKPQTGVNLPLSSIPGLSGRLGGSLELRRLGDTRYIRKDASRLSASFGQGVGTQALGSLATQGLPLSASVGISKGQTVEFTREFSDYYKALFDGIYFPTSIPKDSRDIGTIDVGTMVSFPVHTRIGPGVGMEKVFPLFGKVLGDRSLVARAGGSAGLFVEGDFDVHLFRRADQKVGMIIQARSVDGYSIGLHTGVGTYYLEELTEGQYGFATKKAQSRLKLNPLSLSLANGSRQSASTAYHEFDFAKSGHQNRFDQMWDQVMGRLPVLSQTADTQLALTTLFNELRGGASATGEQVQDQISKIEGAGNSVQVLEPTEVHSVSTMSTSFSQSGSINVVVGKGDAYSVHRFSKFAIAPQAGEGAAFGAQVETNLGTSGKALFGLLGEGSMVERNLVRALGSSPDQTSNHGIFEITKTITTSENSIRKGQAQNLYGDLAVKLGPLLFNSLEPSLRRALNAATSDDETLSFELRAGLSDRGFQQLKSRFFHAASMGRGAPEENLSSFLLERLGAYFRYLQRVPLLGSEKTAIGKFIRPEADLWDRVKGRDGYEKSFQKFSAFFIKNYSNWENLSEESRDRALNAWIDFLDSDPVLRQVGIGFFTFVSAGGEAPLGYERDPRFAAVSADHLKTHYKLEFLDHNHSSTGRPEVIFEGTSHQLATRFDAADLLSQTGSDAAFNQFKAWTPSGPAVDPAPGLQLEFDVRPAPMSILIPGVDAPLASAPSASVEDAPVPLKALPVSETE